jgi:hypothetical protein
LPWSPSGRPEVLAVALDGPMPPRCTRSLRKTPPYEFDDLPPKNLLLKARKRDPWLDEVVLNGVACRGTARGDAQLRVDRTHMRIDRRKTNHQLLGNLDVGQSHRQQA